MPVKCARQKAALLLALALCLLLPGCAVQSDPGGFSWRTWVLYGHDNPEATDAPEVLEASLEPVRFDLWQWLRGGWSRPVTPTPTPEPTLEPTPRPTPTPSAFPLPSPTERAESFDPYAQDIDFLRYNFSSTDRFESTDDLLARLVYAREYRYRQLPLRLAPSVSLDDLIELLGLFDWACRYTHHRTLSIGDRYLVLAFDYPAGTRIADAYLRGVPEALSDRERQVHDEAAAFVEAPGFQAAPQLERERRIHDFLCERIEYWSSPVSEGSVTDFQTAVGAWLDGRGNCMAYADAFGMLARMAGFRVFTLSGTATDANGEQASHAWNLVELDQGWYMVDVTYDDIAYAGYGCDYTYFNIGTERMSKTHSWDPRALFYPAVQTLDAQYAYGNPAFPDLQRVTGPDALDLALLSALNDPAVDRVRILCDRFDGDLGALMERIRLRRPPAGWQYIPTQLEDALYLNLLIER